MESRYKLQIIDKVTNEVAEWEPGRSIEVDFVADIISRTIAKGVGIFRTSSHVANDVEDAIKESIFSLKSKVTPRAL